MHSIRFESPGVAALAEEAEPKGDAERTLIRTAYSIVSPGTELAILKGTEGWAPLPYVPGYGSVGRIEAAAKGSRLEKGQTVFTYGKHSELAFAETLCVPVPEALSPEHAVFARIAAVSITAVRVSEIEVGDEVAVFGAGLVGNFAAQLARAQGAFVTVFDPSPARRKAAVDCGIHYALDPGADNAAAIADITGGRKYGTVIDATGIPKVVEGAIKVAGKKGELILLGSPRGAYQTDLTAFLNFTHLCPGNITVKGAHEWRYHTEVDPAGIYKHSLERNVGVIFRLMAEGRLAVKPLLTNLASPASAQKVYDGLKDDKDNYLGVVFDWRKV
jgi:2-desacetyl-2-hydroxyethyl bacteriochlorophyllide A dehydrogenase